MRLVEPREHPVTEEKASGGPISKPCVVLQELALRRLRFVFHTDRTPHFDAAVRGVDAELVPNEVDGKVMCGAERLDEAKHCAAISMIRRDMAHISEPALYERHFEQRC